MIAALSKYHRLFLLEAQATLSLRLHPFLQTLVFMVPVVGKILFWKAVYRSSDGDIGGYDEHDMVLYLIASSLVTELTWAYGGFIREEIRSGGLSVYLLRPASFLMTHLFTWSGNMVPRWASASILVTGALVFFRDDIRLSPDWWIYPAALVAILVTFLLKFLFNYCMSLISFWTEGSLPLVRHVGLLLGGSLVPLSFLPDLLQVAAGALPFAYMLYFPTTVLMGRVDPVAYLQGLAVQVFWIAVFAGLAQIMWRRGLRRYVAYGG